MSEGRSIEPAWARSIACGTLIVGVGALVYLGTSLALLARSSGDSGEHPARPRGCEGTLLVCGGGGVPESVLRRFIELAGGRSARLVVIPTAGEWADEPGWDPADAWRRRGISSVTVLHTMDRRRSNDPAFVRPLHEATAVWIGGGHQSRLSEAYAGTAVERALQDLLKRNGVIGGTSAGAGIMSRVMIVKGRDEADVGPGFDLFPDVVIDQHFLKRNRFRRLMKVLEERPGLLGIGVDEETALEVDLGAQRARVLGTSYAVVCVPDPSGGTPHVEVLKPEDEADLRLVRRGEPNAVATHIEVEGL
jgi:cyanophycinase